jgi:hypothetical protein
MKVRRQLWRSFLSIHGSSRDSLYLEAAFTLRQLGKYEQAKQVAGQTDVWTNVIPFQE